MKKIFKTSIIILIILLCVSTIIACDGNPASECEHDYKIVDELVAPTCLNAGKAKTKCEKCGAESEKVLPIDENEHIFSTDWYVDDDYHWHEATCGHIVTPTKNEHDIGEDDKCKVCGKDFACNHEWNYTTITASTCTTKGEQLKECSLCQEKSIEPLPLDSSNHTYSTEWVSDNEYHWHKTDCGHFGVKDYMKHYFGADLICDVCKHEHVEHIWDEGVFDANTKYTKFTCTICKETKEELGLANLSPKRVLANSVPIKENEKTYYQSKLSIEKSSQGKFIFRKEDRTYYHTGSYNLTAPTNRNKFKYIGTLYPTAIYEAPYSFTADASPNDSFGYSEFNASNMNTKLYNFIRYMYISTGGKLELSFEYDTSFMYKSPNQSIAVRGRFIVEKCDVGLTDKNNLNDFLTQIYVEDEKLGIRMDYIEFFEFFSQSKFEYGLVLSNDNTVGLQKGDYVWCDLNMELALISLGPDISFWSYMLANTASGQADGMYNY